MEGNANRRDIYRLSTPSLWRRGGATSFRWGFIISLTLQSTPNPLEGPVLTLYREFGWVFPVEVIDTVETSIWVYFSPSRGIFNLQRHVAPPEGENVVWRMMGGSQVAACERLESQPFHTNPTFVFARTEVHDVIIGLDVLTARASMHLCATEISLPLGTDANMLCAR